MTAPETASWNDCGSSLLPLGETLRLERGGRIVTITAADRFRSDDSLSLGDTDDCGWVATYTARPATDAERATVFQAEDRHRERQRALTICANVATAVLVAGDAGGR